MQCDKQTTLYNKKKYIYYHHHSPKVYLQQYKYIDAFTKALQILWLYWKCVSKLVLVFILIKKMLWFGKKVQRARWCLLHEIIVEKICNQRLVKLWGSLLFIDHGNLKMDRLKNLLSFFNVVLTIFDFKKVKNFAFTPKLGFVNNVFYIFLYYEFYVFLALNESFRHILSTIK